MSQWKEAEKINEKVIGLENNKQIKDVREFKEDHGNLKMSSNEKSRSNKNSKKNDILQLLGQGSNSTKNKENRLNLKEEKKKIDLKFDESKKEEKSLGDYFKKLIELK